MIDNNPQNISELSNGETQYSVSGIKGSEGKTHSVSLRAKTSAGYGAYSDPVVFIFQPIGEVEGTRGGGGGGMLCYVNGGLALWPCVYTPNHSPVECALNTL